MAKKSAKTQVVHAPKKKNLFHVGTISGMDILMQRQGRVIMALNPEIHGSVHKSKKDYDRKSGKVRDFERSL